MKLMFFTLGSLVLLSGCIYNCKTVAIVDSSICSLEGRMKMKVHVSDYSSCIYPPETILTKQIFHVKSEFGVLWEPILRLPTLPLELLYNAYGDSCFTIQSRYCVGTNVQLKQRSVFENDVVTGTSLVTFPNRRKLRLPFIVANQNFRGGTKETDKPVMEVLYGDAEGWLWFGGYIGRESNWGVVCEPYYHCPDGVFLCKVSSVTGEIVPVVLSDESGRIHWAPGQTDFVELKDEHEQEFFLFRGVSRIFMQSSL